MRILFDVGDEDRFKMEQRREKMTRIRQGHNALYAMKETRT